MSSLFYVIDVFLVSGRCFVSEQARRGWGDGNLTDLTEGSFGSIRILLDPSELVLKLLSIPSVSSRITDGHPVASNSV